MSQGDKATRRKAIPFLSVQADGLSDLLGDEYGYDQITNPENISNLTKVVPMTRPDKGDIVEAYLFMEMTAPSDRSLEVKIGIGTWVESGGVPTLVPDLVYSQDYIDQQHRKITGQDSAFSVAANGTLVIDANLLPAIVGRGDDNFLPDMFPLLVTFNEGIDTANGYELDKFKLTASAQQGLGR